ncbi:sigma-54 dependent transcriptional regulator [Cognatishimia sp. F0-27]|uniref:sigma-54-dependent transcriptional regulator n=1 Tax=Cognatishimia sp. F0-27 TaxID=2816855 RepID=UPI001D0CD006|nr:sigma-54 dependent transcriptional regulator [Cognatishimia sp. F0-27]MCC1492940.1 sigma-54-dependent Fis family transcriptional regulator [Cognatishimia sp. F0-27]
MKDRAGEDYGEALAAASVLVIDDEPGMRNFLTKIVGARVKRIEAAASPAEATRLLDEAHFDIVILDNIMPGKTGLEWVTEQQRRGFFADVILITAYADLETAIAALRAGVSDFVLKPFRGNQILGALARTLDRKILRRDNTLLRRELSADGLKGQLLGTSPKLEDVRGLLQRLAPMSTPVLFTGASGTGKEVAARTLHQLSDRALRPFVAVNCAAIAPDRIAQELFGVIGTEGNRSPGLFLLADSGTLFLDEVAQMPDALQAALLRALEDQRIRAVGGERDIPLNLRLMFATNADLGKAVEEGRFRADLYHRINVVNVEMPHLRDRAEDIVSLAAHFMEQLATSMGVEPLALDEETLLKLRRHDWPGNVRELRNVIERSLILGGFPEEFAGSGAVTGARAIEDLELITQRHILHILDRCGGNRAEAARRLGVSRKTIDRKVATWDL